jgi:AcrR family transcriptional regulator
VTAPAVAASTSRAGRPPRRLALASGLPTQRDRLIAAMGELVAELKSTSVGVHHVCQRAGVSRRTYYELWADRDACLVETLEEGQARLLAAVDDAVGDAPAVWEDRAADVVRALVATLDAEPVVAYLCLHATLLYGSEGRRIRHEMLDAVADLLGEPPHLPSTPDFAFLGALGGIFELAGRNLADVGGRADLAAAMTYTLLAPFVGRRQAIARATVDANPSILVSRWLSSTETSPAGVELLITQLTRETLDHLAAHPGTSNTAIAKAVDVRHESQMTRHLQRLERAGLVEHRKEGRRNAWRLTALGRDAVASVHSTYTAKGRS